MRVLLLPQPYLVIRLQRHYCVVGIAFDAGDRRMSRKGARTSIGCAECELVRLFKDSIVRIAGGARCACDACGTILHSAYHS